jgi:CheY-like chemotaxis protein
MLGRMLRKRLEPKGFEILIARHKQEAAELLRSHINSYFAVIVDVMLPMNSVALKELERLEEIRAGLLDQLDEVRRTSGPEVRAKAGTLKMEIDAIDEEVDKQTNLEGGIELIEEVAKNGIVKVLTIFLTARSMRGLRERANKSIETGKFYWLPKPATAESIAAIIHDHLAKQE